MNRKDNSTLCGDMVKISNVINEFYCTINGQLKRWPEIGRGGMSTKLIYAAMLMSYQFLGVFLKGSLLNSVMAISIVAL